MRHIKGKRWETQGSENQSSQINASKTIERRHGVNEIGKPMKVNENG